MDEQLNYAPCGFFTLSKEEVVLSVNETLLELLGYHSHQVTGRHINTILAGSARLFFQLYFIPLIRVKRKVEEMYLSLETATGEEVPVLVNASLGRKEEQTFISCVVIPMRRRNEYENQLLQARKTAEEALEEKNKANLELEQALKVLESKQAELLEANKQNQKYKTETQKELRLAKKIQETALTEAISGSDIQMESYYKASSELSGDIYGFYQINSQQYGVILLDVMGHGISSALITMSLQSLFQRLISRGTTAAGVMKELDNHMHHLFQNNEDAWHYCTAVYLFIDTNKQTIEYVNAGHPPAFYQEPSGQQRELHAGSPPIGCFEGLEFKTTTFTYRQGGRLLLYTDGVSEPLEPERLAALLAENSRLPLPSLKKKLLQILDEEGDDAFKNDDQCFLLAELT